MNELLIRKDGSRSIANTNGVGVNSDAIDGIIGEHLKLRADGFHTGQVSSGAALEGLGHALAMGLDPEAEEFSEKLLAMAGVSSHFEKWRVSARESGLLAVSSLSTAIELKDAKEGKQIRGGMGDALARPKVLLVANYHDEADAREMTIYEQMLVEQGNLLRTESEENDFHATNIALAVGAGTLMLCTKAEGFKYKGRKLNSIDVEDIPKYLRYIDRTKSDELGGVRKGGMTTKLKAAEKFITGSAKQNHPARVVIGHSAQDSRRLLEDNAGTWVVH